MNLMHGGIRSALFVPADDVRKLARALHSEADALVLDLEDAVPAEAKQSAREHAVSFIAEHGADLTVIVRINGTDSSWFDDDIAALRGTRVAAIMLPKATVSSIGRLGDLDLAVVALVETARGVEEAFAIAASPAVSRLMLGSADLAAELGIALGADETEMLYPRARVAMASAAAGKEPPLDVVHLAVVDPDGLRASAERGRQLGFSGKACIHPAQVDVVNEIFSPTADEVLEAHEIVTSFEAAVSEGRAVATIAGRMIDLPVVQRARRVLAIAESYLGKEKQDA